MPLHGILQFIRIYSMQTNHQNVLPLCLFLSIPSGRLTLFIDQTLLWWEFTEMIKEIHNFTPNIGQFAQNRNVVFKLRLTLLEVLFFKRISVQLLLFSWIYRLLLPAHFVELASFLFLKYAIVVFINHSNSRLISLVYRLFCFRITIGFGFVREKCTKKY